MERSYVRRIAGLGVVLGWLVASGHGQTNLWIGGGASWTNAASWDTGVVPDDVGAIANFTSNIAANLTITLSDTDSSITNGTVIIGDASHGFRFAFVPANNTQWVFDDTDGLAEIVVTDASNTDRKSVV